MIYLKSKFKIIIIVAFFSKSLLAHSQKSASNFFEELSFGASFPTGSFANKTYDGKYLDNAKGLAKTGISMNLSVGYKIKENWGLLLTAGYSQNKQDANSYSDFLKRNLGDTAVTTVETSNWQIIKIMPGAYLQTPLAKKGKVSLRAKLQAGICKSGIPAFKYTFTLFQNGNPFYNGITSGVKTNLPWAFCYQLGAGAIYKLTAKLHLLADISYFSSTPVYKYTTNTGPAAVATEKKISLTSVQITAGAGINF